MTVLSYTLLADGTSDRMLMPIIEWVVQQHTDLSTSPAFCSPAEVGGGALKERLTRAIALFPCELVFLHRDAEHPDNVENREQEITDALEGVHNRGVSIVPVRMTESWLLIYEAAIRRAAGNPNGRIDLDLPKVSHVEKVTDPKDVLLDRLKRATELPSRRLRGFNEAAARARVAELVDDFSSLRAVPAFKAFELSTKSAIEMLAQSSEKEAAD